MRILIATDAWHPQVNGVVRTYQRLQSELARLGVSLSFLTPKAYRTLPFPLYPDVQLALPGLARTRRFIEESGASAIHIATEGPVGQMVRRYCLRAKRPFTTSYHTKFPEYLNALMGLPESWTYGKLRRFHNAGRGIMVATPSLAQDLKTRGFENLLPWTRGVDTELFRPREVRLFGDDAPVFLYVGRVSKEKNIEAFLRAELPGRKVVVGDGPQREKLQQRFPDVLFAGAKSGELLAEHYASADVFVFPSRTDTFGLVLLEAMASGVPVAAFPVTGPLDVVKHGESGVLSDDLALAAVQALKLDRRQVRRHAAGYSWPKAAERFLANLETALGGDLVTARTSLQGNSQQHRNTAHGTTRLAMGAA